jgi:hypothetical protein
MIEEMIVGGKDEKDNRPQERDNGLSAFLRATQFQI